MLNIIQITLAFLVTIGILVTVHEWGHFWVARRLGVKILRFSVGFGQPLWKRKFGTDQTEFVLAALPLGGFVQMLDEREGEVPEAEAHRAFNRQSLGVRSAIVVAGPLANLLFAVFAYALMYVIGVSGIKPMVGDVLENTPAARAGFVEKQEVLALNGILTPHWQSVLQTLLSEVVDAHPLEFRVRDTDGNERTLHLELDSLALDDFSKADVLDKLGLHPYRPAFPAIIERVKAGSPAAQGGLQDGDQVLRANGEEITDWPAWSSIIRAHPEQAIEVVVAREGSQVRLHVTPADKDGEGLLGVYAKSPQWPPEYLTVERYGLFSALRKGVEKTSDMIVLTLRMMGKMLTLQISPNNISGPISIAEYAGHSMSAGGISFLSFLALVSISIGVLNLLPIPVLDGGHLFVYTLEALKGSPLSEDTLSFLQRVGLTLLLLLMGLAFFNDINRIFG